MILYTREFELEAGDGTQGSEEIRPQGVSWGNDPLPDLELSELVYASLCHEFREGFIFWYFVGRVSPKAITWNNVHEVWEPYG
jgi:hypothetical protein